MTRRTAAQAQTRKADAGEKAASSDLTDVSDGQSGSEAEPAQAGPRRDPFEVERTQRSQAARRAKRRDNDRADANSESSSSSSSSGGDDDDEYVEDAGGGGASTPRSRAKTTPKRRRASAGGTGKRARTFSAVLGGTSSKTPLADFERKRKGGAAAGADPRADDSAAPASAKAAVTTSLHIELQEAHSPASLDRMARAWAERLAADSVAACGELALLFLNVCGCRADRLQRAQLADLDEAEGVVLDMLDRFDGDADPAQLLNGRSKEAKTLKRSVFGFLRRIIRFNYADLHDDDDDDEEKSEESGKHGLYQVLQAMGAWLVPMTALSVRVMRSNATLLALHVVLLVSELCFDLDTSSAQAAAAAAGQGRAMRAPRLPKLDAAQREEVEETLQTFHDKIFAFRYRDIDSAIRVESLKYLTLWIVHHPGFWLDNLFLRYFGWLLSDKAHQVRNQSLKSLNELYRIPAFKEDLARLTEKFKPRILEMGAHERDASVRANALKVVANLAQADFLGASESAAIVQRVLADASSSTSAATATTTAAPKRGLAGEILWTTLAQQSGGPPQTLDALISAIMALVGTDGAEDAKAEARGRVWASVLRCEGSAKRQFGALLTAANCVALLAAREPDRAKVHFALVALGVCLEDERAGDASGEAGLLVLQKYDEIRQGLSLGAGEREAGELAEQLLVQCLQRVPSRVYAEHRKELVATLQTLNYVFGQARTRGLLCAVVDVYGHLLCGEARMDSPEAVRLARSRLSTLAADVTSGAGSSNAATAEAEAQSPAAAAAALERLAAFLGTFSPEDALGVGTFRFDAAYFERLLVLAAADEPVSHSAWLRVCLQSLLWLCAREDETSSLAGTASAAADGTTARTAFLSAGTPSLLVRLLDSGVRSLQIQRSGDSAFALCADLLIFARLRFGVLLPAKSLAKLGAAFLAAAMGRLRAELEWDADNVAVSLVADGGGGGGSGEAASGLMAELVGSTIKLALHKVLPVLSAAEALFPLSGKVCRAVDGFLANFAAALRGKVALPAATLSAVVTRHFASLVEELDKLDDEEIAGVVARGRALMRLLFAPAKQEESATASVVAEFLEEALTWWKAQFPVNPPLQVRKAWFAFFAVLDCAVADERGRLAVSAPVLQNETAPMMSEIIARLTEGFAPSDGDEEVRLGDEYQPLLRFEAHLRNQVYVEPPVPVPAAAAAARVPTNSRGAEDAGRRERAASEASNQSGGGGFGDMLSQLQTMRSGNEDKENQVDGANEDKENQMFGANEDKENMAFGAKDDKKNKKFGANDESDAFDTPMKLSTQRQQQNDKRDDLSIGDFMSS